LRGDLHGPHLVRLPKDRRKSSSHCGHPQCAEGPGPRLHLPRVSASRTAPERLTRLAVVISLVAAVWLQASAVGLAGAAASAFVVAWLAGRLQPAMARRAALFVT